MNCFNRSNRSIRDFCPVGFGRSVAAFSVLGLTSAAGAAAIPFIGVQYQTGANGGSTALAANQTAGVVPQDNYNVVQTDTSNSPITTGALNNASGTPTGITLTFNSGDAWTSGTNTATLDGILLSGEDKSTKGAGNFANYTLNNVPAGTYDLIVYTVNDASDPAHIVQGATTYYITDQTGSQWNSDGYIQGNATTSADRSVASYVEFDNIVVPAGGAGVSFQDYVDSQTASVNGFQLVSVPEPALLGSLGICAVGFLARRRRV